jgi:carbon monoxide dehydrogenase subunit G
MEFQGTVAFAAEQTAVWYTLTTPTIVSQCAPYLKGWSASETNTQFQLQLTWGNGNNTFIIPLLLTWQTVTPPIHLQWHGQAQMGSAIIPLQGDFYLVASGSSQTNLTFSAMLTPPNKLLGQMIQSAAPRLIEGFFRCLKKTAEAV